MDRRSALKYMGAASAVALFLPSCVADEKKVSIALNRLKISANEEELLAQIAATLIPATDTPGAKEVAAHHFALVMIDDCTKPEDQQRFLAGMRKFESDVKKISGSNFLNSPVDTRTAILNKLVADDSGLSSDVRYFYQTSKRYILQGYRSCQHFLTEIKPYQHVPGPGFNGCKLLSTSDQKIIS